MKCPTCRSSSFRLSHRRTSERLCSFFFPFRPYRCNACERRVWGFDRPMITLPRFLVAVALILVVFTFVANFWLALQSAQSRSDLASETPAQTNQVSRGSIRPDGEKTRDISNRTEPEAGASEDHETALGQDRHPKSGQTTATSPQTRLPLAESTSTEEKNSEQPEIPKTPNSLPNSRKDEGSYLLQRLEVRDGEGHIEIILGANAFPREPRLFYIEAKNQWVLDLPGKWDTAPEIAGSYSLHNQMADRLRTGRHTDFFRLVIDLKPGGKPRAELSAKGDELYVLILE